MVAHPPCTFLTGSSVQWLSHPEDKALPFEERRPHPKYPNRRNDMLDEETKQEIDSMDYASMLHLWRFAKVGHRLTVGEVGKYFAGVMAAKKQDVDHVAVSKEVGWRK